MRIQNLNSTISFKSGYPMFGCGHLSQHVPNNKGRVLNGHWPDYSYNNGTYQYPGVMPPKDNTATINYLA